jgi:hypothetical protein
MKMIRIISAILTFLGLAIILLIYIETLHALQNAIGSKNIVLSYCLTYGLLQCSGFIGALLIRRVRIFAGIIFIFSGIIALLSGFLCITFVPFFLNDLTFIIGLVMGFIVFIGFLIIGIFTLNNSKI